MSAFRRIIGVSGERLRRDQHRPDRRAEPDTLTTPASRLSRADTVLAVNAAHGILIVEQTGRDTLGMEYAGKIALCKKPKYLCRHKEASDYGSFVSDMVRDYDAVLGINASGFADFDGNGTGGTVYGFLKSQGEKYQDAGDGWKIIGFDNEDHLQVGAFNDTSSLRDAVEFHPALIINGENLVAGTGLNEQQPRTVIGQAKDGTVIVMVIDQMHRSAFRSSAAARSWSSTAHIRHPCWTAVRPPLWSTAAARSPVRTTLPRTGKAVIAGCLPGEIKIITDFGKKHLYFPSLHDGNK